MHLRGLCAILVAVGLAMAVSGTAAARSAHPDRRDSRPVGSRKSLGCDAAAAVATGETQVELESGGSTRWYIRHVPASYDPRHPMPVVVDLHGYSEGARVHLRMTELGAFGDANDFATITPQGQGPVPRWDTRLESADVRFIGDLLDDVEQTLCIDTRRVYATGLSNGAFMASAVACAYADRVAAVGPVAGIRDVKGCDPARRVPVLTIHGTADTFVSFDGGFGPGAADLPAPDGSGRKLGDDGIAGTTTTGPSIPEITSTWAKRNGCAREPTRRAVADDVTLVDYRCPARADVEMYRVEGGGHTWPGSEFSRQIEEITGPTTFSISANEVLWDFFQRHPLRGT